MKAILVLLGCYVAVVIAVVIATKPKRSKLAQWLKFHRTLF